MPGGSNYLLRVLLEPDRELTSQESSPPCVCLGAPGISLSTEVISSDDVSGTMFGGVDKGVAALEDFPRKH